MNATKMVVIHDDSVSENEFDANSNSTENKLVNYDLAGQIVVPLFLFLGLLGNSLTILVMSSRHFRGMAVSKILIALSVSDTTFICLFPFNKQFVRELLGVDIRALSAASCKIYFWAFRTAKMTSSWFVVLICIERFVAIWFSIKASRINTNRKAYICIAAVVIVIGSYNGYWCSFADQIVPNGSCVPNTHPVGMERQAQIFLILGLTLYSFLPGFLICLFNGLIIVKIAALRNISIITEQDRQRSDTIKTTVMLISISIAFIFLVIPISVAHLYFFSVGANIFEASSPDFVRFRETAQILEQLNYSINFFLYIICGSRFRERVLIMFRCRPEPNKPTPPTSQTTVSNLQVILDKIRRRSSAGASSLQGVGRQGRGGGSTVSLNVLTLHKIHGGGGGAAGESRGSLDPLATVGNSKKEQIEGMHRVRSGECFNVIIRNT